MGIGEMPKAKRTFRAGLLILWRTALVATALLGVARLAHWAREAGF